MLFYVKTWIGFVIGALLFSSGCAEKRMETAAVPREHRAVWVLIQQLEGDQATIKNTLKRFREANINDLCVDVDLRGSVIYPNSACLPQLPSMDGRDVLPFVIREAHTMGMKVEAWTEYGFYAYHTADASKDPSRGRWLDAHPDLAGVDSSGHSVLHNNKWGDFFPLDASNPAAQNLVLDLLTEIVRRYPFDGINLDRIRYATATYGYSQYVRTHFKADTGISLDEVKPGNEAWKRWREWRKEQLTRFMKRASNQLRATRSGLRITMATVPPESIDDLGQDWPTWLDRGYLDAAYPMLYGPNPEPRFRAVQELTHGNPNIYAGLDITPGFDSFKKSVDAWRAMGYRGVTIWQSSAFLNNLKAVRGQLFENWEGSPLY